MNATQHTVESLADMIESIVVERQELRGAGAAGAEQLERNGRRLVEAQSIFYRLLIAPHLPLSEAA